VGSITSILILNYTAAPFILLSASDSIYTWKLLGWYGHIVVMGGLAFFYLGGTKYLKGLQKTRGIIPPSKGVVIQQPNGVTPIEEKNFVLPPAVDSIVSPPGN
jgi:lysophospholipid acyltransferase